MPRKGIASGDVIFTYDAAGRVTQVTHKRTADQSSIAFDNYVYDQNGNATSITDAEGTHAYAYDALNRLTAATHPAGTSLPVRNETFSYDAVGNRLADAERTGYTYDAANRLVADSSFTYTYDADGNMTSRTDRVSGSSTTFVYNSSDQLIEVDASTYTVATYKYDTLGNRVEKNVGGSITRYVYDGPNMLAVLDGNNQILQFMTQGPGVDAPIAMRQGGTDYFYHEDALGSVTALTDGTGHTVETAQYQAFGKGVVKDSLGAPHTSSSIGNTFLFAARELDSETGLYFNRARLWNPSNGRFLSEDSVHSSARYLYAENNPRKYVDPYGADAMVIIQGRTDPSPGYPFGNPFGHAAIAISGEGVYSFGNESGAKVGLGGSLTDYLQMESKRRDTWVYLIPTTRQQDRDIVRYLNKFADVHGIALWPNNCADRTEGALKAGRIALLDPTSGAPPIPLPQTLQFSLDREYKAQFIPRNVSIPPNFAVFNKDFDW